MSLTLNMNGGGSKVFGTILVNYPAGATVSISPNAKYKDITTGQRVYYVKAAGTYTVTATDGVDTETDTVTISYDGQISTISLSFQLLLIDGMYTNTTVTGAWSPVGLKIENSVWLSSEPTIVSDPSYIVLQNKNLDSGSIVNKAGVYAGANRVDLSKYHYLVLEYDVENYSSSASASKLAFATLIAHSSDSLPSLQSTATFSANLDAAVNANNNGKLSDQKMVIDLTASAVEDKRYLIGVGSNARNYASQVKVTIKKLYATNEAIS